MYFPSITLNISIIFININYGDKKTRNADYKIMPRKAAGSQRHYGTNLATSTPSISSESTVIVRSKPQLFQPAIFWIFDKKTGTKSSKKWYFQSEGLMANPLQHVNSHISA